MRLSSLLATGCFFYDSTWHQETQSQERQAAELTPDAPRAERTGGGWRALHEVRVRAWATEGYRAEVHAWSAHVQELLDRASAVLGPALGLRLVLADARPWQAPQTDSLPALLEELAERDAGDDVDLVIGLLGSLAQLSASFDALGMARLHGQHLVVRAMNDAAEHDAIDEAFDRLSEEERARVRRRREAHKETTVLLHEIAHAHGAIHVRDRTALMNPLYDGDMEGFAPQTLALIRPAAAHRRRPEGERDDAELVGELLEALREREDGWVAAERRETIAAYEQVLRGTSVEGSASAPERSDGAGTLWDITTLTAEEQDAFHRAREAGRDGKLRESWQLLAPLAERHPDVYAVHELACELYNRRVAVDAAESCQRMMDLATGWGRN